MQFKANALKSNNARDSALRALGYDAAAATVTLGSAAGAIGRQGEQVYLAVLLNSTDVAIQRAAKFTAERLMKKARESLHKSQVVRS